MLKDYSDIGKALPGLKHEYNFGKLEHDELLRNPVEQFAAWLEQAVHAGVSKPDAMVLSTADGSGRPSSRIVLLKGFNEGGFVFFTNYSSPKGKDLEENPQAEILFFWPQQERQIRIHGRVEKVTRDESESYFHSRPDDAKLASWISEQSAVVADRRELAQKVEEIREKFRDKPIPLPPFWGGYRLHPAQFEFWQGREHRLNDRFRYRLQNKEWLIERLQP